MDGNALDGFSGELVLLREVRWSKLLVLQRIQDFTY